MLLPALFTVVTLQTPRFSAVVVRLGPLRSSRKFLFASLKRCTEFAVTTRWHRNKAAKPAKQTQVKGIEPHFRTNGRSSACIVPTHSSCTTLKPSSKSPCRKTLCAVMLGAKQQYKDATTSQKALLIYSVVLWPCKLLFGTCQMLPPRHGSVASSAFKPHARLESAERNEQM
jgi:hypothetical protein